jgi:hypothetical protein
MDSIKRKGKDTDRNYLLNAYKCYAANPSLTSVPDDIATCTGVSSGGVGAGAGAGAASAAASTGGRRKTRRYRRRRNSRRKVRK